MIDLTPFDEDYKGLPWPNMVEYVRGLAGDDAAKQAEQIEDLGGTIRRGSWKGRPGLAMGSSYGGDPGERYSFIIEAWDCHVHRCNKWDKDEVDEAIAALRVRHDRRKVLMDMDDTYNDTGVGL